MTDATFTVPDMSCAHCVATIRAAFAERMPGLPVAIDLAAKRVSVPAAPEAAASVLREAGYPPA